MRVVIVRLRLLVVIITTILQYHFEHRKVLGDYNDIFYSMCLHLLMIDKNMNDTQISLIRDWLDNDIHSFNSVNKELTWFSHKKWLLQNSVSQEFAHIWLAFEMQRLEPSANLITKFAENEHIFKMLDQGILFLAESIDVEMLKRLKKAINSGAINRE